MKPRSKILSLAVVVASLLLTACESAEEPGLQSGGPAGSAPPGMPSDGSTTEPAPPGAPAPSGIVMKLGNYASLGGFRAFPAADAWNQDISSMPVDPDSDLYISRMNPSGHAHPDFGTVWAGEPIGIPYQVVSGSQPKVPVTFAYAGESDPGPYPIPADVPIQGGSGSDGDRHVIVVDRDNLKLYELYRAFPDGRGGWRADSGAVYDLARGTTRPSGWTSADAAGLPIFPGLARYDEVMIQKEIRHALRFTASRTQNGFVAPARHSAGIADSTLPPMGTRVRLKASYDISWASGPSQVVLRALKKYGMILADNGPDWMISGAHHPSWDDRSLDDIKRVPGSAFEVVRMGPITRQAY